MVVVATRRLVRWLLPGAVSALSLGTATDAGAHGGVLRAFEILHNASKPELYVVRSDTWGFLHSSDAGESWQWSCTSVYGSSVREANHVGMALTKSGRLLVSNYFTGIRYTDDFCSWSASTGIDPDPATGNVEMVNDVKVLQDGTILALGTSPTPGGMRNRLWKSIDDGATFTVGRDLDASNLGLRSLAQSPSRPERLYVTGGVIEAARGAILRSDDGGATFVRLDAPYAGSFNVNLRIHAVHPTNPDIVFAWVDSYQDFDALSPDEIWVSGDAGLSWKAVMHSEGDLPGLAFSPDGRTVALAGPVAGIHVGTVARVVAEGRTALTAVSTLPAWGLYWDESGLVAGKDNFSPRGTPETFTMGVSRDNGVSFQQSISVCDVQFSQCAVGTDGHDMCQSDWDDPVNGGFVKHHVEDSERCEAPLPDAGLEPVPPGTGSGGAPAILTEAGPSSPVLLPVQVHSCSCSAPGRATPPSRAVVALALGALGAGFLRRRR